eukprot:scaffold57051_cov63-Phaeocystis_antarctica.AAC.1
MRANAKPAAAPGDGAPDYEDPALIKKMRNQRTKPGRAMPVRAHPMAAAQSPRPARAPIIAR